MPRLRRPKILEDIQPARRSVFRAPVRRVNLAYRAVRRLPLTRTIQVAAVFAAAWLLIVGSVSAPTASNTTLAANTGSATADERQALEAQLADLENQINQYESQVTSYRKQGTTLKGEIDLLNGKISKLQLQIKAINLTLKDLDTKITETKSKIATTEESITNNKQALSRLLQNLYENDQLTVLEIFLKNPRLSDFFNDFHNLTILQNDVRVTIGQITDLRNQLQDQQEQFAVARADAATLKQYQLVQVSETDQTKQQKNSLLTATKGQESRYQQLLKQTKETAAQIRSRIFQLLGGGELSFEEAYSYAKLASGATGVRAALILAVLDRESALGKNVGRCSYKASMSPSNQKIYLQITSELGINPDTMTVSCANADGIYGGAMGPAQFVPSTWMLYKPSVQKITGRAPASPWNNADAFVATALYLKDAGAANASSLSAERKAAARYYAGGNWSRYLWTYGEAVVSRAQQFEEDIAAITA